MENAEEIFHFLEDFSKRKPKIIPQELNEYLAYVARTGDPVYQWSLVKSLFKEKLLNVITDFYETTPGIEIPPYPNVDPFNYDIMKNSLLERLDSFTSAPFTVQRICELLTFPRKQYNRIDKFMRAIEKNILVVSTREPGIQRHPEENGEVNEPIVNGSDNNSEYNVDVEMEDMSWKENNGQQTHSEPQPSSSDTHISVDDIEARLKAKEDSQMDTQEKTTTQYESVTPPELNVTNDSPNDKPREVLPQIDTHIPTVAEVKVEDKIDIIATVPEEPKVDVEMKTESDGPTTLVIPEIRIDDAEMTEQKLIEQAKIEKEKVEEPEATESGNRSSDESFGTKEPISAPETELPQAIDESSSDSKDEPEIKLSEVLTSSEESSSSSDNTESSSSPKTDEGHIDIQEETNQSDSNTENATKTKAPEECEQPVINPENPHPKIESDNYSISDVNSELKEPPLDCKKVAVTTEVKEEKEVIAADDKQSNNEEKKPEIVDTSLAKEETETQ